MDLAEHFNKLLRYDIWANREFATALQSLKSPLPSAERLFSHVVSAEHVWLARLTGVAQPFPVWPEMSVAQAAGQIDELAGRWKEYFQTHVPSRLGSTVTYKNTKGESWSSTVEDILTHAFFHSAYHRGQIAKIMRDAGIAPPYTDFIHALRQGLVS